MTPPPGDQWDESRPERSQSRLVIAPIPSSVTKGEAAYMEIRSRILDGSIPPGTILVQSALAKALDISITPLREALHRLEGEGLLATSDKVVSVVQLTDNELQELRLVRLQLAPLAAALAAIRHEPDQLQQVRSSLPIQSPSDLTQWHRDHLAFHRSLDELSQNRVLITTLNSLWERMDRYRVLTVTEQEFTKLMDVPHDDLVAAIASRDQKAASQAMFRHLRTAPESNRGHLSSKFTALVNPSAWRSGHGLG